MGVQGSRPVLPMAVVYITESEWQSEGRMHETDIMTELHLLRNDKVINFQKCIQRANHILVFVFTFPFQQ